jgi:heme-degrading monooxygenase HmoA
MPVVKINAIEVPADAGPELEKRFAHRAHAVESSPGFLGFQLLRPIKGEDRYFVVTQWESEEAFQAWAGYRGSRRPPGQPRSDRLVAAGIRGCVGRCRIRPLGVTRARSGTASRH